MSLRATVQQGVKDATGVTPATSDYPEFKIPGATRGAHSKLIALDFRKTDFGLFRNLLGRIKLWKEGGGPKKAVNIQRSPPPSSAVMYPSKEGKTTRSAGMNKELLDTLKEEVYMWWKQGQVAWKEYRGLRKKPVTRLAKVKPR